MHPDQKAAIRCWIGFLFGVLPSLVRQRGTPGALGPGCFWAVRGEGGLKGWGGEKARKVIGVEEKKFNKERLKENESRRQKRIKMRQSNKEKAREGRQRERERVKNRTGENEGEGKRKEAEKIIQNMLLRPFS